MQGLYLYCIRQASNPVSYTLNPNLKGIGDARIFGMPYKDIEAIVSSIDTKEFTSKEITQKAKEDVKWIIGHAQNHEKVIEHATGIRKNTAYSLQLIAVIPMKFGMIFKDEKSLETMLKKNFGKFRKILKDLNGKQEWGVKVYTNEKKLKAEIKLKHTGISAQIKKAKKLPRGQDYFQELETEKSLNEIARDRSTEAVKKFFTLLKPYATKAKSSKILTREFTGQEEPMILNSVYLIEENAIKDFMKRVTKLKKENPAYKFDCTGPWPAYNFV
jgi:hypothetical protein